MNYCFAPHAAGKRTLVARGGSESNSTVLEVWMGNRVTKELHVPKKLHGSIFNDGWFGTGAAWNADESRVAYVAEVSTTSQPAFDTLSMEMRCMVVAYSRLVRMTQLCARQVYFCSATSKEQQRQVMNVRRLRLS